MQNAEEKTDIQEIVDRRLEKGGLVEPPNRMPSIGGLSRKEQVIEEIRVRQLPHAEYLATVLKRHCEEPVPLPILYPVRLSRKGWELIVGAFSAQLTEVPADIIDTSKCKPSTNIEQIAYCADLFVLIVKFKGSTYVYGNVEKEIAELFAEERDSLGILLSRTLKADPERYPAIKLAEVVHSA